MNVEFCNSKAFKIESNDLKEKVMLVCDSLFGIKLKRGYFPGPQPVAVEKKNLTDLIKNEYMVCEKSDGERAILLLIHLNNKPMCFLINRNNELYFMDLSFKREVFEGTVMDGELIKTKKGPDGGPGNWNFLIHDCMIYNGSSFIEKNHRLRYACIIDFILKRYVNKENDCINIKTKIFYRYGPGIEKTWDNIEKTTENKIDGLIFTPINGPVKFGRDNALFKWKLPENNTIDLLIKQKNKKIIVYYTKKTELIEFKKWSQSSENYKKVTAFAPDIPEKGLVIEFKVVSEDSFIPYKIRTDKILPNGEITIFNTFKNVQEAITIDDLKKSFSNTVLPATTTNLGNTLSCTNSGGSANLLVATPDCGLPLSTNSGGSTAATDSSSSSSLSLSTDSC